MGLGRTPSHPGSCQPRTQRLGPHACCQPGALHPLPAQDPAPAASPGPRTRCQPGTLRPLSAQDPAPTASPGPCAHCQPGTQRPLLLIAPSAFLAAGSAARERGSRPSHLPCAVLQPSWGFSHVRHQHWRCCDGSAEADVGRCPEQRRPDPLPRGQVPLAHMCLLLPGTLRVCARRGPRSRSHGRLRIHHAVSPFDPKWDSLAVDCSWVGSSPF